MSAVGVGRPITAEVSIRAEFNREGFHVRRGLFRDEIALLDALLDTDESRIRALEDVTFDADGRGATNMGYLGHGDDVISGFVAARRMVDVAADLLGEEVYLLKARINVKWPQDAPQRRGGWDPHQDRAAWAREGLPGKAALTVALAVDRCDAGNGAMAIVPRSHRGGILEHERLGGGFGVREDIYARLAAEQGIHRIDLDAGDALFFSGDLVHMSPPNESDRRRGILFITYNAVSNSPAEGVGPSRYRYLHPLEVRPDDALPERLEAYRAGAYTPSLDYDAIERVRRIDVAEGLDSGWTELTPTLFEK